LRSWLAAVGLELEEHTAAEVSGSRAP
jgi:hypothetical protein